MTPEAQRIAIAKACGWKNVGPSPAKGVGPVGLAPRPSWPGDYDETPDYINDLNAMHEAEKTLIDWVEYRINLSHVVGIGYAPDLDICDDIKSFLSATAAQRAEAFMRTKGLWKEKKE